MENSIPVNLTFSKRHMNVWIEVIDIMKYNINFPKNPFDEEAYIRLIQRELHSEMAENIRLKRELDDLKKKRDIPSAYPGSTFGLVYQECEVRPIFAIDKVLFNPPATIVFWLDGTKTVVKCKEGEEFSEWAGIALCLAKKLYGPNFHKIFRAHCSDPEKTVNDISDSEITKEEFLNELERNFPRTDAK